MQNVVKCAALQRSILEDIWQCLKPGGILIYSTCTFNTHEDEENVKWICDTLGAETITINTEKEWNLTGSLLPDWQDKVYRFIPGVTQSEGLFMAVLRKTADNSVKSKARPSLRVMCDGHYEPVLRACDKSLQKRERQYRPKKELPLVPVHAEALLVSTPKEKYSQAELSRDEALRYLHHESIVLDASIPRGYVVVNYQGHPLGFVKNIGNRANNLYPQEWKIRKDVR